MRSKLSTLGFVLILSALIFSGCSPATAQPTPTPDPTPTPAPVQASGWEEVTVRTICLDVEQSYPEIEGKSPEPIDEFVQGILASLGLRVAEEGEPCDVTLTITLAFEALSAGYRFGGTCYSGASAEGEMVLAAPGRPPLTLPILELHPCPVLIRWCPKRPSDAPFERAWRAALLKGLAHSWGPQVLIQALDDEEGWVREVAAEALGEFGPEEGVVSALSEALGDLADVRKAAAKSLLQIGPEAAVPALTQALGDENSLVRRYAAEALGRIGPEAREAVPALIQALGDEREVRIHAAEALKTITGQDFDKDVDAWKQWWEDQQSPIPVVTPTFTPAIASPTPIPIVTPTFTPAIASPTPVPGVITYTVQAGDTLSKIAKEFEVTVEAIVEANDIEDTSLIRVGQVLTIPLAKPKE